MCTVYYYCSLVKVPLYPGSAVTITKSSFVSARQAGTATSMARALRMAVFDLPTLLHSNLKGGASKRPGAKTTVDCKGWMMKN